MGMSFHPSTNAAQIFSDSKELVPAPLKETFRAMITQVLSVGTFHGSLDYDGLFETSYGQDNIQTATHQVTQVGCELQDNLASLTAPQLTPGNIVRQVLDPVLSDVFQICPSWTLGPPKTDLWLGRLDAPNGLSIMIEVTPAASAPSGPAQAAKGAFVRVEAVVMN